MKSTTMHARRRCALLLSLLLPSVAAAAPPPTARVIDDSRAQRGQLTLQFGDETYDTLRAAFDVGRGVQFRGFPLPGRTVDLELHPLRVTVPGFTAEVVGPLTSRAVAPSVVTFRGRIAGIGSYVFLAVSPSQTNGYILDGPDRTYVLSSGRPGGDRPPGQVTLADTSMMRDEDQPITPWMCNVPGVGYGDAPIPSGDIVAGSPRVRTGDVFMEADHDLRAQFPTAEDTVDYVVSLVAAASDIYRRDLGAPLRLPDGYVRVWERVPPWGEATGLASLIPFANYWRSDGNPLRDLPRTAVHLLTHPIFGGLALAYGGICSHEAGYALSSLEGFFPDPVEYTHADNWDLLVVSHEFGHAYGSVHTFSYDEPIACDDGSGPDNGTIMSYCNNQAGGVENVGMRFHPTVQASIRSVIEAVGCLDVDLLLPGDYDADGDRDQADLDAAQMCMGLGFASSGCLETFDLDGDGALTYCDYALLEALVDPQQQGGDCNGNGAADSCEDCNGNRIADDCDIADGVSTDCNGNGVPDECEALSSGDCDGNGVSDFCEIASGAAVDQDGNGIPDTCQQTWPVPSAEHPTIQSAVDAASPGDVVLLADGTYQGPGNRQIDMQGKLLTVRSEHGPEACIIDAGGSGHAFVFQSGETAGSRVEGLTIVNGATTAEGGAIVCRAGSAPTIVDCVIESGTAIWGAGVACIESSDPTLIGCTIRGNVAERHGGGVYAFQSRPVLIDCTIEDNTADIIGGGLYLELDASATVIGSRISGNDGSESGGGINCITGSNAYVAACEITGNTADEGGGICATSSQVTVVDSLIANNTADEGGGLHTSLSANVLIQRCTIVNNESTASQGHAMYLSANSVTLTDSILYSAATGPEIRMRSWASAHVRYSAVDEGSGAVQADHANTLIWGPGNLDTDPVFVDPDAGDHRLAAGSPGIDAGDPAFDPPLDAVDLDGHFRLLDGDGDGVPVVDMGAYERDPSSCAADLDGNGDVGVLDLAILIGSWGPNAGHAADLDGDGVVGPLDLIELVAGWGPCGS